jgi:hypothetical protein
MVLLPLEILSEKYNLNLASIKTLKHRGSLSPDAFHRSRGSIYAKEEYFVRRINFFYECIELSQKVTYLLEEHFSQSEIAREILRHNNIEITHAKTVSMSAMLREGLFTRYFGVELLKVNKLIWYTARYAWAIERRLKRRGTSIDKILDRRMYEA